jgi:hypothetical protein
MKNKEEKEKKEKRNAEEEKDEEKGEEKKNIMCYTTVKIILISILGILHSH